jgi:hypothetical protein
VTLLQLPQHQAHLQQLTQQTQHSSTSSSVMHLSFNQHLQRC